jgi:hypothetical protein
MEFVTNYFKRGRGSATTDFGCGDGANLRAMHTWGAPPVLMGVEGTWHRYACGMPRVMQWDLSVPLWLGEAHVGNVLSLEVGEHIPQEFEGVFLDTLCRHCNSRMVLSWALPEQRGTRHVNPRTNEWVIAELRKRGFMHDTNATDAFRAAAKLPWFKHSIMAFIKIL